MKLVRSVDIAPARKREHTGPVAGGMFWAIDGLNDLPVTHRLARADAGYLIRHGDLFVQDADIPGSWKPVRSVAELVGFHRVTQDGSPVDGTFTKTARKAPSL